MISRFPVLPISAAAAALLLTAASFAADDNDNGLRTADQAKAMLAKAVAAVKADRAKALDMFNKGEGGFRDGNLYVFCITTNDGKFVATGNPNAKQLLGVDVKTIKDGNGDPIKLERATQKPEGEITTIDYSFTKPGANKKPVPKETFITTVSDLTCGVGTYYFDDLEKPADLK